MFVKSAKKPEIALIYALCAGALTIAGSHLFKLASDPHTMYSKSVDKRRWEEKSPSRYMTMRWSDVMKSRPGQ